MLTALLILMAVEVPVTRIADDAKAVDRIAAASKHDMPAELLRRMLNEDVELLRGRRSDGGYDYASFERLEASRTGEAFSVEGNDNPEKLTKLEVKGSWVYRLIAEVPSRRMLVSKNRRVFIDHIENTYIAERGGPSKVQTITVQAWIDPGATRNFDLEAIAKQATVRVYARAEKEGGYGNIVLSLVQARISDNPDSPYADAIASAKAILRALDHDDTASMRAMAQRMASDLVPAGGQPSATAAQTVAATPQSAVSNLELLQELQSIEDLLTGSETERRQGLDRLHQLIRKLRPEAR